MNLENYVLLIPAAGVLALIFAWFKARGINKLDPGGENIQAIGRAIREGAMAFLAREYKVLAIFVLVVAMLLGIGYQFQVQSLVAVSFVVGAACSALSGYFGMKVATAANMRTANAARESLNKALGVAFNGGSVMGMSVVGLGVLGLGGLYIIYRVLLPEGSSLSAQLGEVVLPVLSGFSLGASSIALFARVGGGIYTKAADVGADLVGKVEAGIPEDDPRNPAVIADNVGDNVGDVAGMGADLFESYVGAIVGAMVLGATVTVGGEFDINFVLLPLMLAGVGIVASILGTFMVRSSEGGNPQAALNMGSFGAAVLTAVIAYVLIAFVMPQGQFEIFGDQTTYSVMNIFWAMIAGLVAGVAVGLITEYYTSESRKPRPGHRSPERDRRGDQHHRRPGAGDALHRRPGGGAGDRDRGVLCLRRAVRNRDRGLRDAGHHRHSARR